MPTGLPGLFVFNHWNANKPGTTLFLPVSNMTLEYINLLFIYFSPEYRFTLVDETAGYAPCGLQRWIDSGRLDASRQMGIVEIEQRVLSMQVVEQAFICQNINLALQAMGLGGWTYTGYIARFALGGMDVPGLGFRFADAKRGPSVPVGRDGVFEAFTPPYHDDMGAAVDAFLERKWSQYEPDKPKAYLEPDKVTSQIERPSEETIEIVKDYCRYVHETYGRFPAYLDPMYQRLTAQAQHVDPDFYARYYPPGAVTEQHHAHFERWHPELAGDDGRPPLRDESRLAERGRPADRGRGRSTSRARLRARSARPGRRGCESARWSIATRPLQGVALGPRGRQLGDQPVALGPQGLGVDAVRVPRRAVDGLRGDQGALGAGLADGLAGQPAGLEVAPDGALGDAQRLGGLGDGDGAGGGVVSMAPGSPPDARLLVRAGRPDRWR